MQMEKIFFFIFLLLIAVSIHATRGRSFLARRRSAGATRSYSREGSVTLLLFSSDQIRNENILICFSLSLPLSSPSRQSRSHLIKHGELLRVAFFAFKALRPPLASTPPLLSPPQQQLPFSISKFTSCMQFWFFFSIRIQAICNRGYCMVDFWYKSCLCLTV